MRNRLSLKIINRVAIMFNIIVIIIKLIKSFFLILNQFYMSSQANRNWFENKIVQAIAF